MVYLSKKNLKGRTYFYLVKCVRINKRWKKFTIYIGKNKPSEDVKERFSKILEDRIRDHLCSIDPLYSLLSGKQLKELERLKEEYERARDKLPEAASERFYEWFVTKFTYNTNAIEGSTVNLRETALILFDKTSPSGRTLREVREVENHKNAFDFVVSHKGDITRDFVLRIHRILTSGILGREVSGRFREVQVYIRGVQTIPPRPEQVEEDFKQLMRWYRRNKHRHHPIIVASYFHAAFEGIHPFIDFNGRTGRLLLNFILTRNGYPAIDIRNRTKQRYYEAIRRAQDGKLDMFVKLIAKYVTESIEEVRRLL